MAVRGLSPTAGRIHEAVPTGTKGALREGKEQRRKVALRRLVYASVHGGNDGPRGTQKDQGRTKSLKIALGKVRTRTPIARICLKQAKTERYRESHRIGRQKYREGSLGALDALQEQEMILNNPNASSLSMGASWLLYGNQEAKLLKSCVVSTE